MATLGGGFQKSDNAPAFQATSPAGATKQLYQYNIKDIKLEKIGAMNLMSELGIFNKLMKAKGFMTGKWKSFGGISMAFTDSRASSTLMNGLVPQKMITSTEEVRGYLNNYSEYFGAIGVNMTCLLYTSPSPRD